MKKVYCLIFSFIAILGSCEKINFKHVDYRNKYCGDYNISIYSFHYYMGDTNHANGFDTINVVARIDKFKGYNSLNGSNFIDIEHKIGILFSENFTFNAYSSSCNDKQYFTDGYIHPTISNSGILTYPEFTCDMHSAFNGEITNDSIKISLEYSGLGASWTTKIIGKKMNK